ncbi:MAG: hypothetical protein WA240_12280 [Nitrospirota bacterium]
MKKLNLRYINSLSKEGIVTIDDILKDQRLYKHLWIELIFNSKLVMAFKPYIDNAVVKNTLADALSWYLAFRWLFPENKALEELYRKNIIAPYRIKNDIYRQNRRSFLKGIVHAHLI